MRKCTIFFIYFVIFGATNGFAIDIKRNVKDSSEVSEGPSETNFGPTLKNTNKFNRPSSISTKRDSEDQDDQQQPLKIPKINNQGTQCYDVPSSKRSVDLETDLELSKPKPYEKYKKRRSSPYGIVYNQGRPIGILEPISKVYEFEDYKVQSNFDEASKAPIDKRGSRFEDGDSPLIGDGVDKYANVLNNFKIGNRIKVKQLADEAPFERKREKVYNKRQTPEGRKSKNLNEIEDNLKEIMSDLGLVDDVEKEEKQKRETGIEDEDLENGVNKIGLIKESHNYERNKKEDCPGKTIGTEVNEKKAYRKGGDASILSGEDAQIDGDKKMKKGKITDYRSEGEAFIRSKRQQNDIMKGLETSGDLTVSGNKSPLASSSTGNDNESKQKAIARDNEEKRDKQMSSAENQEYEKRLQRNIQNKISEIKEEVKREIKVLKGKEGQKGKGEEKKKREGSGKGTRKKRFLMEKESKDIDPLSLETDLAVHIRRRRHVDEEKGEDEEKEEGKRVTWTEVGGLDKREGRERPLHDPKGYKFEGMNRKVVEDSKVRNDFDGFAKRSDDGGKVVDGNSGFRDVQNRAVAGLGNTQAEHVLAARDSARNAHVASETELNSAKLERLVSESASLTDNIKNERGARSESPRIEVELHNKDLKPKEVTKLREDKKAVQKEEDVKGSEEEVEVDKRSPLGQEFVYNESKGKVVREAEDKKVPLAKPSKETSEVNEDKGKEVEDKKEEAKIAEEEGLKSSDVKESVLKRSVNEGNNVKREGRSNKEDPKIEPDLTLEDMQKLDSENTVKRRKRTSRIKRDFNEPNMQFRSYRGDEDDADDEADEFDDDNFDDRTANLIRKRDIYEDFDDDDYTPLIQKEVSKRNARLKNFVADLNSDVYETPNYLYTNRKKRDNLGDDQNLPEAKTNNLNDDQNLAEQISETPTFRKKRDSFADHQPLSTLKKNNLGDGQNLAEAISESPGFRKKRENVGDVSGGVLEHFGAVRERNLEGLDEGYRRKRLEKMNLKQSKDQTITGLSESDIFGGLPQSYEGELSRFKRVKREDNLDKGS